MNIIVAKYYYYYYYHHHHHHHHHQITEYSKGRTCSAHGTEEKQL
jgi:hypothetical protein